MVTFFGFVLTLCGLAVWGNHPEIITQVLSPLIGMVVGALGGYGYAQIEGGRDGRRKPTDGPQP